MSSDAYDADLSVRVDKARSHLAGFEEDVRIAYVAHRSDPPALSAGACGQGFYSGCRRISEALQRIHDEGSARITLIANHIYAASRQLDVIDSEDHSIARSFDGDGGRE